jgi:hypothetical protein
MKTLLTTVVCIRGKMKSRFPFLLLPFAILVLMATSPGGGKDDSQCMSLVSLQVAHTMYAHYSSTLNPADQTHYSGYSVNVCQLDAMKAIFSGNTGAVACRLYPSYESEQGETMIMLVIGVDIAGRDVDTFAYKTSSALAGFCPRLCDMKSPLLSGIASDTVLYRIGEPLSVSNASKLIANYREQNLQTTGGIRSFKVSREQFLIMERLADASSVIKGFRLYFGHDKVKKSTILLIVPMGSEGADLATQVYPSSMVHSGLCPHYCDAPGSIETGE